MKFRPQGREGAAETLAGFCQVLEAALVLAHKERDRLVLARELMRRVTAGPATKHGELSKRASQPH